MTTNDKFYPKTNLRSFKEHIKPIISNPFNAIVEIIANSSDAGATRVNIKWPEKVDGEAKIEDNGEGMSNEKFIEIWLQLSYNRLENQGKKVMYEVDKTGNRDVYGSNGKGRHAPFCFNSEYFVETVQNNEYSKFKISLDDNHGFEVVQIEKKETDKNNGTVISFNISKNHKDIEKIRTEIAARFLKDPSFNIYLNKDIIEFADVGDKIEEISCKYLDKNIRIFKMEANNASKDTKFHGITWRIGNRVVKNQNWEKLADGRKRSSKKYSYIVCLDALKKELNETMSDFKGLEEGKNVKKVVSDCIKNSIHNIQSKERNEDKEKILLNTLPSWENLSNHDKEEVGTFITTVQKEYPTIEKGPLEAVSKVFIKMKQSKSGYELLYKLSKVSPDDIDTLNEILNEWDTQKIKIVLDEICLRLKLIKELELKTPDKNTDEEELQALFEKSLWMFGYEYESGFYTSDKTFSTIVKKIFKKKKIDVKKSRLRPDFVVLPDSVLGMHSVDRYSKETGEIEGIGKILLIELKKGGHKITLENRTQTENYMKIFYDEGIIDQSTLIDAYVLGCTVDCDEIDTGPNKQNKITPMSFHVILSRAEKRLLGLRRKIRESGNITGDIEDSIVKNVEKQKTLSID